MENIKDIFAFLMQRKKYWLIPVVFTLILLAVIVIWGGSSAIAPFIYTLF